MVAHERLQPSDVELSRAVLGLAHFVQRWDLYAVQLDDGRYICVRSTLNWGHLNTHALGKITLGIYVLDKNGQTRFVVVDDDAQHGPDRLGQLAKVLAEENVPAYLEKSRRGGHLWFFFAGAVPGRLAREFGKGLLAAHNISGVELFPKQDQLGEGPGSLIRLPFGVHRLSKRRYGFITPDGEHLAPTIREQIQILAAPETVSDAAFEAYRSHVPVEPIRADLIPPEAPTDMVSDKIKAAVSVLEFVSEYVDLKPTESGAIGLCPFHDDHHPSFSVNAQENYWHCFAGCGGGSVIDFYMKWRDCDFTSAITELARMLL